ncbi:MAG: hypothetical protein WC695_08880 [Candidatus Omnitrophota bacterium]
MLDKTLDLSLDNFKQEGLYLIFPDSTRVELTGSNIQSITKQYWDNPQAIPERTKEAIDFQRCSFCPLKNQFDLCDALRPVLPLLNEVDKYASFEKVTAVYRGTDVSLYHIADTPIQEALRFISILSLMQYCQIGRKFWQFYFDIIPLMSGEEIARRMYLNIYWLCKGDQQEVDKTIASFEGRIRITSTNQVKRMNLICKKDAFMNAFANSQAIIMLLSMCTDKSLNEAFEGFKTKTPV